MDKQRGFTLIELMVGGTWGPVTLMGYAFLDRKSVV